eukprot:3261150-Heterocapsa_arctica.AAC.1
MEELKVRQSKEFCISEHSEICNSLEAKSNHGTGIGCSGLKRCLGDQDATEGVLFTNDGSSL